MLVSSGRGKGGNAGRDPRSLWVQAESIASINRVVSDLGRAETFYRSALGFETTSKGPVDPEMTDALGIIGRTANEVRMRLGQEHLVLVRFEPAGAAYPAGSRSDDLWFQHIAIVVSDMGQAYARLRSSGGWEPISADGPQTLPASSGNVRAFKFRDPDGHPLELLWFPPGRGRALWHDRARSARSEEPFLGIDHSALAVSSTRRSLAFYHSLGLQITARSLNRGPVQSRLDGLAAAQVRVTGLRPGSEAGPGLELLAYRPPGRPPPPDGGATDLSTDWITLTGVMAGSAEEQHPSAGVPDHARPPRLLKKTTALSDPDGHRLVLVRHRIGSRESPA